MGFRMLPAVVAIATVALLSGCVPQEPVITPEPEPSSTPVFASDEEALAAATDAYAKYLEVSDQITADGGANPERIARYVTSTQLPKEVSAFQELIDADVKTQGESKFDVVKLQQYSDNLDGTASIVVYLCVDVSAVRVVDSSGIDVTRGDRIDRFPLEVGFAIEIATPKVPLISRSAPWTGTNFCQ